MKDTLTILKDAYAIIRDPERWTTRNAALDAFGRKTDPYGNKGVKFCGAGAIWYAAGPNESERLRNENVYLAFEELKRSLSPNPRLMEIAKVNDGPEGHALICAAFRKAIADLTPRENVEKKELVTA